jgi:hypothetical protein
VSVATLLVTWLAKPLVEAFRQLYEPSGDPLREPHPDHRCSEASPGTATNLTSRPRTVEKVAATSLKEMASGPVKT